MAMDPFFGSNPIIAQMDQVRAIREQVRENTARLAYSYSTVETKGAGRLVLPGAVEFDCTFVETPKISYGWFCNGDQFSSNIVPSCSGGVFKWITDQYGFYIGAYLCIAVTGGNYTIEHNFTFAGIAYKDLPAHILAQ